MLSFLKTPIAITGIASVSALGETRRAHELAYSNDQTAIVWNKNLLAFTAPLTQKASQEIKQLAAQNSHYKRLDPAVLYGIYCGRKAIAEAGWSDGQFGINVGSSRGATQHFEQYHTHFLENAHTPTLSSPHTTLGNISSWLAHDLKSEGPDISHSITCSTALHAILNGVAWLASGMASRFLVGGTEAALTPFTIAQMKAMKLTPTQPGNSIYPCQTLMPEKSHNTMVLGEGAAMLCLEAITTTKALAYIKGLGYATEVLQHSVSLSAAGDCFQKAMKAALTMAQLTTVDAIVMHAPGTIKGDASELAAIAAIFDKQRPFLTSNKWKLGHTFGASGGLSMDMAIQMLQSQQAIPIPFIKAQAVPKQLNTVMVNAVGFGGNAVSIIISRTP